MSRSFAVLVLGLAFVSAALAADSHSGGDRTAAASRRKPAV